MKSPFLSSIQIYLFEEQREPFNYDTTVQNLLNQKDFLTNWWLKVIEYDVEKWLAKHAGFIPDQIPYDYLDRPPRDLQAIEKNLVKVRQVLLAESSENPDLDGFQSVLKTPLIERIIEKIDQFLRTAQIFIQCTCSEFSSLPDISSLFTPKILNVQKSKLLKWDFFDRLAETSLSLLKQNQIRKIYSDCEDLMISTTKICVASMN